MQPTACPSCRQLMSKHRFARQYGGEVVLDVCFSCQGIWFDEFESLQITPGGIVDLFKLLNEHRDDPHQPLRDALACPRCRERLLHGLDAAKHGGRFNYHRCLQKHGRFITFAQFMIEKGFVRQLNPTEIETLSAKIDVVRCMSCGAPVDIRRDHACGHCRAPIAILDPNAVEQALQRFQSAETRRNTIDVNALGDAIVAQERQKSRWQREEADSLDDLRGINDAIDLLAGGIGYVWNLIRR
ncbi:MAG: zf-TFIIB domain-containing protein [Betaproteobacteria bacterium]|nr:zf-TFIIB domain-containing protein [Betaproteobacteria bacterium]MCL2886242.1 zf-TFIIB domain-containing protein [Betaproteobacteria bacterium]